VKGLRDLFGLTGQTALVMGASSGLGEECARALARAGADVGLVARRAERLEALAASLRGDFGVRTAVAPADVTETAAIEPVLDRVEKDLGPVRVLVNSFGVAPMSRAERHPRDKWDAAVALNLTATFEVAQAVGRRMIERGNGGRIILVSSVMGGRANPVHRAVGYAATKGAVDNLTRQLAVEWAKHGILVNALAPSYFPTEMTMDPRVGRIPEEMEAEMIRRTPLGRVGRAGELETAVLFLAAPASSYVTGLVLPVDGGWTAW
jgi:gluconate 5-dehydrogenase